ncbi:hydrogen peroxide-inducible genes activator [Solemya velum gill symbiont]|uniref:Transcriptional regulator n=1 Tax=Solemya velum gill symbiont TaxID=2340 RepID=A0A0B0HBE9_SOVGS|nr:hydrogen peroxide-inducible genes activator [Solemya velum gill symbiont]KHF25982.1 transcriptional regulator [Solemya velum gill symbiont]OOY34495.1 LysR family transcriptional regulator [Solemya velum gill symbiont]OOY37207.1 LysR family transcriptional regulator [Solemya velum gill symbiont]OOY41220.1 LysR family transcriptional regulator [Solemya velum gill symbiont]OOY47481.1 LysR family transcriptional regulator [Solemya velum gill symbiont]
MTLTELRYIVAVARERHFGRAAETCFVSQPTLSVAIKKLEQELGVTLFERGAGDITVTAVGELVVAQAQHVIEEASKIQEISSQQSDQLSGPLRIGAIYTIGPYLFPEMIPRITSKAPDLRMAIEENYTSVLTARLKQGDLDVVIISLPYEESGIMTMPLYSEPFVLLLPSSHPLNQPKHDIKRKEIASESVLLLGKGHCFRDQVLEYCPECHQTADTTDPIRNIEGGSLETIRYMVASGLGITVLPCTAAGADRFSQRLVSIRRFAGEPPNRTVALAWRKSFPRPDVIALLKASILSSLPSCVAGV